jgi:hypothetical protein
LENERLFRALAWRKRVSEAEHPAFLGSKYAFLRASLWSRLFDIQNLLLETWFEVTETSLGCSQLHLRADAFSGLDAHSDGQRPYFTSPHPFRPLAVAGRLGLNGTMLG